jgi:hypothetical protein
MSKIDVCENCSKPVLIGDWPFCPHGPARQRDAAGFDPVVIHVDKEGNVRFPGRANARVPKGYEKRELTSVREIRQFENKMNDRERSKASYLREAEERFYEAEDRQNRSDLLTAMQSMSPLGRAIAQRAIDATNSRSRSTADPGFHIEAFSFDSSNMPYDA